MKRKITAVLLIFLMLSLFGCDESQTVPKGIVSLLNKPYTVKAQCNSAEFEICSVGDEVLYTFNSPDELVNLSFEEKEGQSPLIKYEGIRAQAVKQAYAMPRGLYDALCFIRDNYKKANLLKNDGKFQRYGAAVAGETVVWDMYGGEITVIIRIKDGRRFEYEVSEIKEVVT